MELRAGILLIQSRAVSFLNSQSHRGRSHDASLECWSRTGGSEFKRKQAFNKPVFLPVF